MKNQTSRYTRVVKATKNEPPSPDLIARGNEVTRKQEDLLNTIDGR